MFVSAMCMKDVEKDLGGSILLVGIGNGFSYGVLVAATMYIRSVSCVNGVADLLAFAPHFHKIVLSVI